MKHLWMSAVAAALLLPATASAADLKKIDRTIAREPAYSSKQPRYCLLVFGPQQSTRVWLVADGDALYVDRNGNGDLTEPGERVRFPAFQASEGAFAEQREAEAGEIREGKLRHEHLKVYQQRVRKTFPVKERWEEELRAVTGKTGDTLVYHVTLTLEIRPRPGDPIRIAGRVRQYAGMDGAGFLQFAARPQEAPVVHFRGPLEMGLYSPQRLRLGADGGDLQTVVGTPGVGPGTFASFAYDGLITQGPAPVAEIEFPSRTSGKPLAPTRYTLGHRC